MTQNGGNLKGIQINCRSVNTGLGYLKIMIYCEKPDFVAMCETWLNETTKAVPSFYDYVAVWKHRPNGTTGGGLGFLLRNGIQYTTRTLAEFRNGVLETQCIRIHMGNNCCIDILNLYNPNRNLSYGEIHHYISQMHNKFLLVGDFNAHSPILTTRDDSSNYTGRTIEHLIVNTNVCLINPINMYTYMNVSTGAKSCLDLCFASSNLATLTSVSVLNDIHSDHFPVKIIVQINPNRSYRTYRRKWKIDPGNLSQYSAHLPTSEVRRPNSIDILVEDLNTRINNTASKYIKLTSGKPRTGRTYPWWDIECQIAVANKRRAKKLLDRHPTESNLENYKNRTKEAEKVLNDKRKESLHKFINEITYDMPIQTVWNRFKAFKGIKQNKDPPLYFQGKVISNTREKLELFAEHFKTSMKENKHVNYNDLDQILCNSVSLGNELPYNNDIGLDELKTVLRHTKNSSPGHDNINYALIKNMRPEVLEELLAILNQCFNTGYFPKVWKKGLTLPILKPGKSENETASYRPITLLPCMGKLFERIIDRRLEYFLESGNKLNPAQCGFRKRLSTYDVLLRIENEITGALHCGEICIAVYIDLKGAFDSVWRKGILLKLSKMGLQGKLLGIIASFLTDRATRAILGATESREFYTEAGTPQGAVLSPKLFNVFLSDIPEDPEVMAHIFADDITVTCRGKILADVKRKIQRYIDIFYGWTRTWGLKINMDKSVTQYFTKQNVAYPIVRINNKVLNYKKTHTVLGMVIDSPRLTWVDHLKKLITNIYRRLDILKAFSSSTWGSSAKMLRSFYIAYVRAKIDYGCVLYNNTRKNLLEKLDILQNKALRMILGGRITPPITSLQVETYLPPLSLHRGFLTIKTYIKLQRSPGNETKKIFKQMNNNNPACYANSFSAQCKYWTREITTPNIKDNNLEERMFPPWLSVAEFTILQPPLNIDSNIKFQDYISEYYQDFEKLYTDGSKIENPTSVAAAMYIPKERRTVCWKLDPRHSICAAELFAIYKTLKSVQHTNRKYVIFTDSKTSLEMIQSPKPLYGEIIHKIRIQLWEKNQNAICLLHWVKAHCGIQGNEIADMAAHHAHQNDRSERFNIFETEYISILKREFLNYWTSNWHEKTSSLCKGLKLREISNQIKYNSLIFDMKSRRLQVLIHRFRMGHIGVKQYLHRFGMADNNICEYPQCNESRLVEDIKHILIYCPKYCEERAPIISKFIDMNLEFCVKNFLLGDNTTIEQKRIILFLLTEFLSKIERFQSYF